MRSERFDFENGRGQMLAARGDLPDGEIRASAVFAHCFTCTKNLRAIGVISRTLTDLGYAVLRFDFTGLGESEGTFGDTNFTTNVADLVSAAGLVERRWGESRLLIGHSLGGAAVLRAAARIPSARAVATIGAPSAAEHLTRHLLDDLDEIDARGEVTVLLAGRPFRITAQFIQDIRRHDLESDIRDLDRPLLVLHSPEDRVVAIDDAAEIFAAARHPKSFVALDGADHLMSNTRDAEFAGAMIGAWASRYLAD